jgi:uncharacterized membrane protein (DUF4010 family)
VPDSTVPPRAISLKGALSFSAALAAILVVSTAIQQQFGPGAMIVAAALAGLVNTQSAAIAVALSVGAGQIEAQEAVLPILAAITTNTLVRILLSILSGGSGFAGRVVPGLLICVAAAWAATLLPLSYTISLVGELSSGQTPSDSHFDGD